ncbi:MAG: hypothetical protein ABIO74_05495 [Dokdonella sp.]
MAHQQEPFDETRRDDVRFQEPGQLVATGTTTQPPASTRRTHKGTTRVVWWLFIDSVLIAVIAYLYTTQLLPALNAHEQRSAGIGPTDPANAVSNVVTPAAITTDERIRLRSEPSAETIPPATVAYLNGIGQAIKEHKAKCIGGRVYMYTHTSTGTTITQVPAATCTL